jgi:hypothetical protein
VATNKTQNAILNVKANTGTSAADLKAVASATTQAQTAFERFTAASAKSADNATKRIEALRKEIEKTKTAERGTNLREGIVSSANSDKVEGQNLRAESFKALGEVGNQLTGTRDFDTLRSAGNIIEVNRRITEITQSITTTGQAFQEVNGIMGKISSTAATAALPLGATAASLAAIAAPLLIIAAPLALFAIQLRHVDDIIASGKSALNDAIERNKAYYDGIAQGSKESLAVTIRDKNEQLTLEKARLADLKATRERAFAAAKAETGGDLGGRFATSFLEGRGAFADLDEEIKALEKSIRSVSNETAGLTDAYNSQVAALRSLDTAFITDAENYLKTQADLRSASKQSADSIRNSIEDMRSDLSSLEGIRSRVLGNLSMRQQEIAAGIAPKGSDSELQKEADALTGRIDTLTEKLRLYRENILPIVEAEERRLRIEKELKEATDKVNNARKELEASERSLADLSKQRARTLEDERIAQTRSFQEQLFRIGIAAAKRAEYEEAYNKKIEDIQAAGRAKQLAITEDYLKNEKEAFDNYSVSRGKLERDFTKESLRRVVDYQKEAAKAQDKYARERIRALQDLNDDLTDLAREGDVLGFITRQRDGERQLERLAEDNDDQNKERAESFAAQNELARENYAEQLRDLDDNYRKEKDRRTAEYRDQINEAKRQSDERLQQERDAHNQRQSQSQRLEQEFQDWQAQNARDDNERRKARETADFEERFRLEQERNAQILAVLRSGIADQIRLFRESFAFAGRGAADTTSNIVRTGRGAGSYGSGSFYDGEHATGLDYVPWDGYIAKLHKGEGVLNANENRSDRGRVVNFNGNISIGEGLTIAQLQPMFEQLADAFEGSNERS